MLVYEYQIEKELTNPNFGVFTEVGATENVFWGAVPTYPATPGGIDPDDNSKWVVRTFNCTNLLSHPTFIWGNNGLFRFHFIYLDTGLNHLILRNAYVVVPK